MIHPAKNQENPYRVAQGCHPAADLFPAAGASAPDGVITTEVGEILIARFREVDVAAGYASTPDAAFRIVSSRTGGEKMRFSGR